jgi:hypothetical protein
MTFFRQRNRAFLTSQMANTSESGIVQKVLWPLHVRPYISRDQLSGPGKEVQIYSANDELSFRSDQINQRRTVHSKVYEGDLKLIAGKLTGTN